MEAKLVYKTRDNQHPFVKNINLERTTPGEEAQYNCNWLQMNLTSVMILNYACHLGPSQRRSSAFPRL